MPSTNAEVLEALRWKKFSVLDDGFICLVDAMGDDQSVVRAARTSYGKDKRGDENRAENADRTLLRYLFRSRHSTPFEMGELVFLVRCPMDLWRQWIRHRTASVSEYSTRYGAAIDARAETHPDEWRLQSATNKQGSAGAVTEWPPGYFLFPLTLEDDDPIMSYRGEKHGFSNDIREKLQAEHGYWGVFSAPEGEKSDPELWFRYETFENRPYSDITPGLYLSAREETAQGTANHVYLERTKQFGVANEQARKDLPLSTYTEAYWKCDLHNLLHFLGLRMHAHAQKEIRDYATIIGEQIIKPLFPLVWEAFMDYHPHMGGMALSRLDIETLAAMQVLSLGAPLPWQEDAFKRWVVGLSQQDMGGWPVHFAEWAQAKCRERDEFVVKAQRLGVIT